jgi:simple sugar transport system ATP-binding protein
VTPGSQAASDPAAHLGPGQLRHSDRIGHAQDGPALVVESMSKSFGPVAALNDVSLHVNHGEVLGLLGDNGAGKSTMVKCLAGVMTPNSGRIRVNGDEVRISSPTEARRLGIETVFQDLSLVDTLNVAANLFLNREAVRGRGVLARMGWLDKRRMARDSQEILDRFGIRVRTSDRIARLSGGQRQAVAVSRAAGWGKNIVIMDEPSAALGVEQSRHVLDLVDKLRQQGVALLLITHNMQQVVDVCDRAVILRHGEKVGDVDVSQITPRDLVDLITGAKADTADVLREREVDL